MAKGNKYEGIRIPILKKTEYSTWRVKMLMFLEATDPDYIDTINDGPYIPTKLVGAYTENGKSVPEHYVMKEKKEWGAEDKATILKDAKSRTFFIIVLTLLCPTELLDANRQKKFGTL